MCPLCRRFSSCLLTLANRRRHRMSWNLPMPESKQNPSNSVPVGALREEMRRQSETLIRELWVPQPISRVFPFFAEAQNLEKLTPHWLRFSILSPLPIEMKVGTLIDYRISLYGIPMCWRTLISAWEPPYRFVDEQLSGPYAVWWHQHTFSERDGGTVISDRVCYRAPLGFLAHPLLVRRLLRRIFDFRTEAIRAQFAR